MYVFVPIDLIALRDVKISKKAESLEVSPVVDKDHFPAQFALIYIRSPENLVHKTAVEWA